MPNGPTDDGLRDLLALWEGGPVAGLPDADLVERFGGRRGPASESAFAALVARHGPMVLATCRRVLGDRHEADDAFQAAFLVLARRAGSLRVGESLGPWLHEVARRVAMEARGASARRRRRIDPDADPAALAAPESSVGDDLRPLIDEELARLPEGFRTAVVLCDLEGLTIEAASRQLGWPFGTVKSRLARGRDRLRDRLARRGLAPTGLAPILVPTPLLDASARLVTNPSPPAAAAVLAAGVLQAMTLRKLGTTAALATLLGTLGVAALRARPADDPPKLPPVDKPVAQARADKPSCRITGEVRAEGTGEPVAGATLDILVGDAGTELGARKRRATTDAEGRYSVDLSPGQAQAFMLRPPAGYWAPGSWGRGIETFVVTPANPVHRKDYTVRRGTVWTIRLTRSGKPAPGAGLWATYPEGRPEAMITADAGGDGIARLTLPTEGGKVTVKASSTPFDMAGVAISLEWPAGFRPDALESTASRENSFRVTDAKGRVATVGPSKALGFGASTPTGMILANRRMTIQVALPEVDQARFGSLSGRVVDGAGRPVEGARVVLIFYEGGGSGEASREEHRVKTDAQGRYLLREIPRKAPDGTPLTVGLSVTRPGLASVDVPGFPFRPADDGAPQVAADVRMAPGVALSGVVVDPGGRPVEGAWVMGGGYAVRSRGTRTDERGRFTVADLPKGMVRLGFQYGKLSADGKYLADGSPEEVKVVLKPAPDPAARPAAPIARPNGLAPGTPAPEWTVTGWTDGKPRTLADLRGQVVYLDFWGDWCAPCVRGLPSLDRLRKTYEPRGVVFVSIHTPGGDPATIRRLFAVQKVGLVSAVDEPRKPADASQNGVTAERYRVGGYPTIVLIDCEGKVAFHSGHEPRAGVEEMKALGRTMGLDEKTMTPEDFDRLFEAFFARQIERVLLGL